MTMTTWWSHDPVPPPPPSPPPPGPPAPGPASGPAAEGSVARRWRRTLVLVGVVGLAFDGFVRSGWASLGATSFVIALVLLLLASRSSRNPQSVGFAVASVACASVLAVRTSAWLVPLALLGAVVLLGLAASYARGGSALDLTVAGAAQRLGRGVASVFLAPGYLVDVVTGALPARDDQRRVRLIAVARGVVIALPVLVVVGGLLASADAVFGSFLHIPVDPASLGQHLILVGVGVVVGAALLTEATNPVPAPTPAHGRPLGSTEASVVLGGLIMLSGAFVAVQVLVAARGEAYVQQTAGVTFAEHARQGFFQLLGVAAITLAVLVGLRALTARPTARERRRFTVLGELAVLLTLGIVGVAIVRLGLYEQAFGLTMLRLACTWVAWWLGLLFVITGVALAGVGERRPWLLLAVGASIVVTLLACALSDPEAVVVRRNVARAHAVGRLDTQYLTELSDDAVPELAAALPQLSPAQQADVRALICGRWDRGTVVARVPAERFLLQRNVAATRADEVRARLCAPT